MMTRKRVGKAREKKQSRRTKYGGNTVKDSYGTSLFSRHSFLNDELITIDLDDESKKTDKSSNDTYWLIGGGLLVALVVGIAVPSALSKKH
jgi:hypothetical protein